MGWECPKCHACYAPSVSRCMNCTGLGGTPVPVTPYPYPWAPVPGTTTTSGGVTVGETPKTWIMYSGTPLVLRSQS